MFVKLLNEVLGRLEVLSDDLSVYSSISIL